MKGNKFLAAVLAASMAFSVVPATALSVFAESISTEASNTAVSDATKQVTVTYEGNEGNDVTASKIQAKMVDLDGATYWDDTTSTEKDVAESTDNDYNGDGDTNDSVKGKVAAAFDIVKKLKLEPSFVQDGNCIYSVDNVTFTNADNWSFNVYKAGETYTVKIVTENTLNSKVADALAAYFDSTEFETTKDVSLRNVDIAAKLNALSATDNAILSNSELTFGGDSTKLASDGSGTITVKVANGASTYAPAGTYKYSFKANVTVKDETSTSAIQKALATVNAKTYPDWHAKGSTTITGQSDTSVDHNEAALIKKIEADLKDAGYTGSFDASPAATTNNKATASADGTYKIDITGNNDVVNVALTYSSDQKIADTQKSLAKFMAKGTAGNTTANDYIATEHKKTGTTSVPGTPVALDDATKVLGTSVYTFGTNSTISTAVQSKDAVKAVSNADAAEAVKKIIDNQLTKDSVNENGVSVTVTPVNEAKAADDKYTVLEKSTAATTDAPGEVDLLVTASIKNDFYDWEDGNSTNKDPNKKTTVNYLVKVSTNKLKDNAATSITLADQTAILSGGYNTSKNAVAGAAGEFTLVTIKPTLEPEDTNTAVAYKIKNSDGDVLSDVDITGTKIYPNGSSTEMKFDDGVRTLKITEAGTYTITATAGDAETTMTLTVLSRFKDVPATAYYAKAVNWADSKDVTDGVSEDMFGTNTSVTRAQYVTWLYRYAVSEDSSVAIADDDVKSAFSDVATDKYYAKAVQWAVANGITDGTSATTFSPDQKISRAQAITMLWRMNGKPYAGSGSELEPVVKFTDVPANAYYTTAVTWAVQSSKDITDGTSTTTFSPNADCTRAQAITFIYRAYA